MAGKKVYMTPGVPVPVIGCYSEAFMHCGHAGRPCEVELVRQQFDDRVYYSGAVHTARGRFTGFTYGEVGIFQDEEGFYTYEREPDEKGDPDPKLMQAQMTTMILHALSGGKA